MPVRVNGVTVGGPTREPSDSERATADTAKRQLSARPKPQKSQGKAIGGSIVWPDAKSVGG